MQYHIVFSNISHFTKDIKDINISHKQNTEQNKGVVKLEFVQNLFDSIDSIICNSIDSKSKQYLNNSMKTISVQFV